MSEAFIRLGTSDRLDALGVAADRLGRPAHLLEKDIWVVWAIQQLFDSPIGANLVFKGGTSLSKAYQVIDRFSEDVDLTFDIRALIPDLLEDREDAVPVSASEERRWSKRVRKVLPERVAGTVRPILQLAIERDGIEATLRNEGDKLLIDYSNLARGTGYVSPSVMLEFGARSTGEPASPRDIVCDAAAAIDGVEFPIASPRVMHAERTFWEKATAIHVFCMQARLRGDRFSRHWHDVSRLDQAGIAAAAIDDRTSRSCCRAAQVNVLCRESCRRRLDRLRRRNFRAFATGPRRRRSRRSGGGLSPDGRGRLACGDARAV